MREITAEAMKLQIQKEASVLNENTPITSQHLENTNLNNNSNSSLWVEKYAPRNFTQVCN